VSHEKPYVGLYDLAFNRLQDLLDCWWAQHLKIAGVREWVKRLKWSLYFR
jgi:hypothetical protein